MTFVEVCQKVIDEGFILFREKSDVPLRYEVREFTGHLGKNHSWIMLDATTANLCIKIYGLASERVKGELDKKKYTDFINICWAIYRKANAPAK